MRTLACAMIALGLLGACSKPSEPSNPAIAADQNRPTASPAPGDNSFTEDQAKGHIENAGYTGVTDLKQDDKGLWHGTATKDGKTGPVSVDYQGSVSDQ